MRELRKGSILFRLALILALAGGAVTISAQQDAPRPEANQKGDEVVRRVIPVKHIKVKEVGELIAPWGLQMNISRRLGLISLVGDKAVVESAEKMIREIDVPRSGASEQGQENVEILFYLLGAGEEPAVSEVAGNDRLMTVVEELKTKFPYRGFQLLETGSLRIRNQHRASTKGIIPGIAPGRREPATYHFQLDVNDVVERHGGRLIQLGRLSLTLRVPVNTGTENKPQLQYQELEIRSETDVLEGKTVVIGKTGVQGSIRGLFLILTANVVE